MAGDFGKSAKIILQGKNLIFQNGSINFINMNQDLLLTIKEKGLVVDFTEDYQKGMIY